MKLKMFSKPLSIGSEGSDVVVLQVILRFLKIGDAVPVVNGFYCASTAAAVEAFQEEVIPRDYIGGMEIGFGPKTRKALSTVIGIDLDAIEFEEPERAFHFHVHQMHREALRAQYG